MNNPTYYKWVRVLKDKAGRTHRRSLVHVPGTVLSLPFSTKRWTTSKDPRFPWIYLLGCKPTGCMFFLEDVTYEDFTVELWQVEAKDLQENAPMMRMANRHTNNVLAYPNLSEGKYPAAKAVRLKTLITTDYAIADENYDIDELHRIVPNWKSIYSRYTPYKYDPKDYVKL